MIKAVAALTVLFALPLGLISARPAEAATLEIGESAFQKLLDSKAKEGKISLGKQDDCNSAYVETMRIAIGGGRVRVSGHLAGKAGKKVAGLCIAAEYPSNFLVSGVPAVSGSTLKLSDIKLDELEKKELQAPLGALLKNFAGEIVQIDLKRVAESALKRAAPYIVTLPVLELKGITPGEKSLTADFDFKLAIQ